jgi:hypothetical protein
MGERKFNKYMNVYEIKSYREATGAILVERSA